MATIGEVKGQLDTHEAVCAERYLGINARLKRMEQILLGSAGSMLAQTDWMVVRKAERNVAIPADVVTKRAAIVAECDRLEAAIAGCADVPALIAVVSAQNWTEGN